MDPSPVPALPAARADVALRRVGSEWVLFDAAEGRAHVLNATAAVVWSFCDGGHDRDAIAAAIAKELPGTEPAALRSDIAGVLDRFAAEGLFR